MDKRQDSRAELLGHECWLESHKGWGVVAVPYRTHHNIIIVSYRIVLQQQQQQPSGAIALAGAGVV
jgi:hypothetical protein